MSEITTTIEINDVELDIEIEYLAVRYCPPSWGYYGGDPGWPPHAELIGVEVRSVNGERRPRDGYLGLNWVCDAYKYVEDHWERFQDMCLEDANDRAYNERCEG